MRLGETEIELSILQIEFTPIFRGLYPVYGTDSFAKLRRVLVSGAGVPGWRQMALLAKCQMRLPALNETLLPHSHSKVVGGEKKRLMQNG